MINACTFITRRCSRNCAYCEAANIKREDELDWMDWVRVNDILHKLGVKFNLILGNESWLLGANLNKIMERNKVPYALYTTCPSNLFSRYSDSYFGQNGFIDNLSCGIDYPMSYLKLHNKNDMEKKSIDAWLGLLRTRGKYPHVDCQGTVTVHRQNYDMLPEIVHDLSKAGIFTGINVIHWNKDGEYDFFPGAEEIEDFLFDSSDKKPLEQAFMRTLDVKGGLIQNREMLHPRLIPHMIKIDWHCRGNPYGGPTIDSDGRLRCCGYRKGDRASQFRIFDLPAKFDAYMKAVKADADRCPGCFWSYPWMNTYWRKTNPEFGRMVFTQHAGATIPKEKWSRRRIE